MLPLDWLPEQGHRVLAQTVDQVHGLNCALLIFASFMGTYNICFAGLLLDAMPIDPKHAKTLCPHERKHTVKNAVSNRRWEQLGLISSGLKLVFSLHWAFLFRVAPGVRQSDIVLFLKGIDLAAYQYRSVTGVLKSETL